MNRLVIFLFLVVYFSACKGKDEGPDVSGVKVEIKLERFDHDFFSIDTNAIEQGLYSLNRKYPVLTPIFLNNILGVDSASTNASIKNFIRLGRRMFDTANIVFRNTTGLEKDFQQAFQHLKYYFPSYPVPVLCTIIGPADALAESDTGPSPNFLAPGILGISLQFYLGKDYSLYNEQFFIEQLVPAYRSRRFSHEYIISDAMQLVISDIFPYKSGNKPLVEQMVERGKRWWLLDKFLPEKHDSIKTGFSKQQLDWCNENEGLIWTSIIKNEDLYSLNPTTIKNYLGEGPFTQGFNQDLSPGNLGQWIGWQIVKRFAEKNKSMKPEELMNMDPKKILDEARYKPR